MPASAAKASTGWENQANSRDLREKVRRLRDLQDELIVRESLRDPLFWARNGTFTRDEQDETNPFKRLPDWEYFGYVLQAIRSEPVLFLKKSRTVLMSWMVTIWAVHECLTKPATTVVIQSRDEERSVHDIDYAKVLWSQSVPGLREKWPLAKPMEKQPYNFLELANGSWLLAISGDPKRINSEHPAIVILDEAALMERGSESYSSALATKARKVIALSSAEPGWFEDYIETARPIKWPYPPLN